MKLVAECTRREYQVEVPVEVLQRIMDTDRKGKIADMLFQKMDELPGVYGTEYDGHFGSYIFYGVDALDDTPELHERIFALIRKYK